LRRRCTELDTIVKKLEDGDIPLEQSLQLFERGVQLSRFCHARLEEAERRIEILNERGQLQDASSLLNESAEHQPSKGKVRRVEYIDARRAEVEQALAAILPPMPTCPQVVYDAMAYSLLAGGKRLRPLLCLASADAVGGDRSLALPAACAIELIHTYSLIHDDLPAMDNDTMRRGRPTLHVVAGEGMAILAGDGLLTQAFHHLAAEPRSTDPDVVARKLEVIQRIAAAAGPLGMVGGQAIDPRHRDERSAGAASASAR
jgi:exodeoxyribonuclease VII small subunit